MRRLVPWALLGLLSLGTVVGAALGAAGSPGTTVGASPDAWVAGVLATTKTAGTAHLAYSGITTSPHPTLRSSASGTGVVDFAGRTSEVSDVEHATDWYSSNGGPPSGHPETTGEAEITIGSTAYFDIGPPGMYDSWAKESTPRRGSILGLSSDLFGAALDFLSRPFIIVGVNDLGSAPVDGVSATRYLVISQVEPSCPTTSHRKPQRERTTVWVDGRGRLVQVRDAIFSSGKIAASSLKAHPEMAHHPFGPMTLTNTLRLSRFGEQVHVKQPTVGGGALISLYGPGSVASCG